MSELEWVKGPDGVGKYAPKPIGGSSPSVASFDATTDPGTFFSPIHVFDLGAGAHVVLVTMTAITLVGDGETFGNDAGEIYAALANTPEVEPPFGVFPGLPTNADGGSNYTPVSGQKAVSNFVEAVQAFVFELQADAQSASLVCLAARYLRVQLGIFGNDTGALYAGANHPTAHATIGVSYR